MIAPFSTSIPDFWVVKLFLEIGLHISINFSDQELERINKYVKPNLRGLLKIRFFEAVKVLKPQSRIRFCMIFDLKSNKILVGMRISKLKTNAEKAIFRSHLEAQFQNG